MARRDYVYCQTFGLVYRFTRRNWIRVLKQIAADHEVNYDNYGTVLFDLNHNITDLDQREAQDLLNDYEAEAKEVAR